MTGQQPPTAQEFAEVTGELAELKAKVAALEAAAAAPSVAEQIATLATAMLRMDATVTRMAADVAALGPRLDTVADRVTMTRNEVRTGVGKLAEVVDLPRHAGTAQAADPGIADGAQGSAVQAAS